MELSPSDAPPGPKLGTGSHVTSDQPRSVQPDPTGRTCSGGYPASLPKARPRHPSRLIDYTVEELTSSPGSGPVLDLGCGPGTLTLDLAERGLKVTAIDPSEEMLLAGRGWAEQRGITGVQWVQGDAEHLTDQAALGPVSAVTIGDAFHWMNRPRVLETLDQIVEPGGCIAVICSRAPGTAKGWWHPLLTQLRLRYLGEPRWAGPGISYVDQVGGHEDVLRRSPFSQIIVVRLDHTVRLTLDEVIGVQATYAYSSPAVLADAREAFEADARATLRTLQPTGDLTAHLAFIARADELGIGQIAGMFREVDAVNISRRTRYTDLARQACGGSLDGVPIALWGASFKPGVDDIRDSPALDVAVQLHGAGAQVRLYDPAAGTLTRAEQPHVPQAHDSAAALEGAQLLMVLTDWPEFTAADPAPLLTLPARAHVIDARNCLDPQRWSSAGWTYTALGRPTLDRPTAELAPGSYR